jgi:hypothetical protein
MKPRQKITRYFGLGFYGELGAKAVRVVKLVFLCGEACKLASENFIEVPV